MKMKHKTIGIIAIMALIVVMISGLVSAVPVLTITNATGTVTGASWQIGFRVTEGNLTNISLLGSATNTENATAGQIKASTVDCTLSATVSGCNITIDTTGLEDSSIWVWYATGQNSTTSDEITSATYTAITVDNTKPARCTGLVPAVDAIQDSQGDVTFSCTADQDTVTGGYIEFKRNNPGRKIYTDTVESGGALSLEIESMPEGIYEWRYVTTDGATNNVTGYQTFTVNQDTGAGKSVYYAGLLQGQQLTQQQKRTGLIVIIVIIIIIAMKKNKKRK